MLADDFLTLRFQRVRVSKVLSDVRFSSTGSPQDCVLSSLVFISYTNVCRSQHPQRHILRFADDSVILSLLSSDDPLITKVSVPELRVFAHTTGKVEQFGTFKMEIRPT